ncbi:hypothetical protein RRG08_011738 [Elysia crispata]|uniref:Uncharacterized protein n=1 Tax=Elysia crispata TaxID=231223 RepID=A0AAE1DXK4_9GAST|nr:hypothetical protein RRG08_011738 [Elysia crispata]
MIDVKFIQYLWSVYHSWCEPLWDAKRGYEATGETEKVSTRVVQLSISRGLPSGLSRYDGFGGHGHFWQGGIHSGRRDNRFRGLFFRTGEFLQFYGRLQVSNNNGRNPGGKRDTHYFTYNYIANFCSVQHNVHIIGSPFKVDLHTPSLLQTTFRLLPQVDDVSGMGRGDSKTS